MKFYVTALNSCNSPIILGILNSQVGLMSVKPAEKFFAVTPRFCEM
jgi:hypothetical protein